MARKATGSVVYDERHGRYRARVTCADGSRPWIELKPSPRSPDAEAEARKQALKLSKKIRALGLGAASARRPLPALRQVRNAETVSEYFERWATAREAKGLASVHDDRSRFANHVEPDIGSLAITEVQREQIQAQVERLDCKVQSGNISWKTAINVWAVLTKMFKDSTKSKIAALRVRTDNPCADVEGPDRGGDKNKVFLYPSEVTHVLECRAVPLRWRRLVALASYLGVRAGELEALGCEDFDLAHGKVTIHRSIERKKGNTKATKSETSRTFSVEPSLLPLLELMIRERGGHGRLVQMPRHRDLAEKLRYWVKHAGVKRAELFISDKTRINLRFHDLRATTVTWMAVRQDSPALIMTRVGHEDWETLKKYLRQAEALVEGFGEVFPALPRSMLGDDSSQDIVLVNRPNRAKYSESLRGGRDSKRKETAEYCTVFGVSSQVEDRDDRAIVDLSVRTHVARDDSGRLETIETNRQVPESASALDFGGVPEPIVREVLAIALEAERWDRVIEAAKELQRRKQGGGEIADGAKETG